MKERRTEFKAVRVSRWKEKKKKKQEPVREEMELQQRWWQNFKLDWIGIKRQEGTPPESPLTVPGTIQSHSDTQHLILISQTVLEIGTAIPIF